jgi:Tol biopolymer transport system component
MYRKRFFVRFAAVLLIAVFMLVAQAVQSQESADELYQAALLKKEAEGDLNAAIQLFQKIVATFAQNRAIAAKAELQIGLCYEKLGMEQARDAFQRVVKNYPEQTDTVTAARERLSVLGHAQTPRQPGAGNLTVRKVSLSDSSGSPSPDGSFISFTHWGKGNLAIRELTTDKVRLLTKNATGDQFVGHSVISPDGLKVAYSWYDERYNFGLWLINVDGSGNRQLYRDQGDWHIEPSDWSPDGNQILATYTLSYPSQASKIVLVAASDGSMKVLKELERKAPSNICFSPDGRFIVYDYPTGQSTTRDIFVMSAEGGKETPLIENPADDLVLGWTPDGRYILFASDRAGNSGAWLIPVRDGQAQGAPRLVKQDLGSIEPMGFTRDGTFYYGIGGWMHDFYAQDVDLEGGKLLGQPELVVQSFIGSNGMPAWSPDGENLAYITRRTEAAASSKSFALCLRSSRDGRERMLFPELDWFQWPRWSPDSKALIVAGSDRNNHLGAYMIDALTGAVNPVLITEKDDYNAVNLLEWSHDGRSVYFTRNDWEGKNSEIILRNLETKQERKIAGLYGKDRFFTLPQVSPDGGSLAALVVDQNQKSQILTVMPAEGGELRELLELKGKESIPGQRGFTWIPGSRRFLFVKSIKMNDQEQSNKGRDELWLLSADIGEQHKLGDLMNGFGVEISLHPSGRSLVFTASTSKSEIWVMENILSGDNAQGINKGRSE